MKTSNAILNADKRAIGTVPWASHFEKVEDVGRDISKVMKKANLDYSFHKEQAYLSDGRPINSYAIVRDSDNAILSHQIGPEWTGIENIKRFQWFEPYLLNKEATIIYAGQITDSIRTKICVIARLDKNTNLEVQKGDEISKYILLSDSFGGSSLRPMLLALRLICSNGMISTSREVMRTLRHSKNIQVNLDNIHDDIQLWDAGFEENMKTYKQLAAKDIKNDTNLNNYFIEVMDFKIKEGKTELGSRQQNTLEQLRNLFHDKKNNLGHSLWTAYNSITAYTNHFSGRSTETAINSLFYGQGANRQARALEKAIEFSSRI